MELKLIDIASAKYVNDENGNPVWITVVETNPVPSDKKIHVGVGDDNPLYVQIKEWADNGELTIADADPYPTNTEE